MSSTSKVPTNLRSIICDFTADLSVVFPEYAFMWSKWASATDAEYEKLYAHCLAIYPERFFDIMYTNADIFNADSKIDVCFLPDVNFRMLFNCEGVSEKTKTSIWKYLQLLLFTIVGSVNDTKRFGDAANIFEAMDENELHEKMAETLESVGEFFKNMEEEDSDEHEHERSGTSGTSRTSGTSGTQSGEHERSGERSGTTGETDEDGINEISDVMKDIFEGLKQGTTNNSGANKKPSMKMPDPEILKEHLKTLLDGKLGKLAKEFTDEFTNDLKGFFDEEDEANMKSSKDVLMKLIKDPKKMVLILKKITTKLQERMKRGDISQEELMAEMSGLMEKMKEMGGGADFAEMMKGLAGTPIMKMFEKGLGGGKLDMNKMTQMSKQAEMKERLRRKMEQKKAQTHSQSQSQSQLLIPSSMPSNTTQVVPVGEKNYVVKIGNEVQAKSGLRPPASSDNGVPLGNGALTEEELISLFSKKNKGAKKTK